MNIIFLIFFLYIVFLSLKVPLIEKFKSNKITIDKIYVINLDKSKDRLKYITKQLKREGLIFERIAGIDGKQLDKNELIRKKILTSETMTLGAIGCYLSHKKIWEKEKNIKNSNFLVLEDDCIITKNIKQKFNEYSKQIPENWDIIYLGGSNIHGKKITKNILVPIPKNHNDTTNCGMYAMLINKKALPQLLKYSEKIIGNIDQVIKNNLFKKLNVYFIVDPLIYHNNNIPSDRRINSNQIPITSWFKNVQPKITTVN